MRFAEGWSFTAEAEERAAAQQQANATAATAAPVPGTGDHTPLRRDIHSDDDADPASVQATIEQVRQEVGKLMEKLAKLEALALAQKAKPSEAALTAAAGSALDGMSVGKPPTERRGEDGGGHDPLQFTAWQPVTSPPGMQEEAKAGPKPLDKKDIEKPSKYSGNVDSWLAWSKSFRKFLRRTNEQWPDLLSKVEDLKGKPVTASHETEWSNQLRLGPIRAWKEQLNEALESYTTGKARDVVDACGDVNALDAWRRLSDKGCSKRLTHATVLRKRALYPRTNVPAKDLENAIAKWESDIDFYEHSTGEVFPSQYRRMNLEDMCPERLKMRLRDMGPERLAGIEEILLEISDWLATEAGPDKSTKNLGAVGAPEAYPAPEEEGPEQYEEASIYCPEWDCWINGLAPKRARTDDGDEDSPMPQAAVPEPGGKAGKGGKGSKGGKGKGAKGGKG